ncbi:MAG: carboxypeptidase regulatory-like domain-containing protein [bacterium]
MARRLWLPTLLLCLAVIVLAGCTNGGIGGSTVVETAIDWISGILTKARGEPIAGATITLTETGQTTTTNSQGRFRIENTSRSSGTVRAQAGGYLTLEWPVRMVSGESDNLHMRLVSLADYDPNLFSELTGATATVGTWRWESPIISYYVDRGGAYNPAFDEPLHEAFTQWSMFTRRAITFVEGGPNSALQISYVASSPCGFAEAAGCAGVTSVTAQGGVRGAIMELHASYATSIGLNVHEIGHTLSFSGHSPNPGDVMYFAMNSASTPSNAEAVVAAILYANPPGATMSNLRFPGAQTPPEASVTAPASVQGPGMPLQSPQLHAAQAPSSGFPELQAVADIGAMIRGWFGGTGCLLNLPLFCNSGPAIRIW